MNRFTMQGILLISAAVCFLTAPAQGDDAAGLRVATFRWDKSIFPGFTESRRSLVPKEAKRVVVERSAFDETLRLRIIRVCLSRQNLRSWWSPQPGKEPSLGAFHGAGPQPQRNRPYHSQGSDHVQRDERSLACWGDLLIGVTDTPELPSRNRFASFARRPHRRAESPFLAELSHAERRFWQGLRRGDSGSPQTPSEILAHARQGQERLLGGL